MLTDTRKRPLRDLRISVTDRCNFRCVYCMPKTVFGRDFEFLPRKELLSFEEIARLARIFEGLGVSKIRLTGGEPLVRSQLEHLVAMLVKIPGLDLTMTTNGLQLPRKAVALKEAGLDPASVRAAELSIVAGRVLPNELGARGVADAESICERQRSRLSQIED